MHEHSTSIFAEMSSLAVEVGAINLGQGFPDTDGPQEIKDVAIAAIQDGRGNQYPPPHGLPLLREAVAAHQKRFYDLDVDDAREVVVGTGASEVIQSALLALVDEGDEVLVFEPWFDIYAAGISLARGRRVGVPMAGPDLRPDLSALRAAVTPRTRLILLNSPHNPTGIVFTPAELAEVAAIAIDHDLLVLSDEAYEHLWFDGHRHVPIATLPGMRERTLTISSGGKTFHTTGWKIGWMSGPEPLVTAAKTAKQFLTYVNGAPFQPAMAVGLGLPDAYFQELAATLQTARDHLVAGLRRAGFTAYEPEATYFTTVDIRPLAADGDGMAFCRSLPQRCGVVAVPNEVFYARPEHGRHLVRFACCKRIEVIDEAVERLVAGFGS